jgi:anaerobic magnesium-protoporphyrin IX monomethyl ester cyclase
MKVLLISLQTNLDTIGLKSMHSFILNNNINSNLLYVPRYKEKSYDAIKKFILKNQPDIVGFSLLTNEFLNCKYLSSKIKKDFPKIKIVWGGVHPTANPEECLDCCDYVIMGEGEEAFLELLKNIKKNEVKKTPNLVYKEDNLTIKNKLRYPCNLEDVNSPVHMPKKAFIMHRNKVVHLNKRLFKKYSRFSGRMYNILTARGCPFSCSYCFNSCLNKIYSNRKYIRTRKVNDIIKELEKVIKDNPELFLIQIFDDCFFLHDLKWIKEFTREYKKRIKINFICQAIPNFVDEEKIKLLKDAGLILVKIGLQSGSKRINKTIFNRPISNKSFIDATKLINKYKLIGYYDIITDNPFEKEEDIIKTIKILTKIPKPYRLDIFSLCFYPGTELHDKAKRRDIKFENPVTKEYEKYRPTTLNNILRLTPLVRPSIINFFIKNRNKKYTRIILNIFHPLVVFEEILSWFWVVFLAFDYSIIKTTKIFSLYYKTGFNTIIRRNND